jgi:hypothetical protein
MMNTLNHKIHIVIFEHHKLAQKYILPISICNPWAMKIKSISTNIFYSINFVYDLFPFRLLCAIEIRMPCDIFNISLFFHCHAKGHLTLITPNSMHLMGKKCTYFILNDI